MTLFVTTPKRVLAIGDAYVMALTFLIFFAVTKIIKAVVEKQKRKNTENVNMPNPRGGDINIGVKFSDDTELANTILTCIADNERYLVKDPKLINIIFNLVKAKIKNESLVLTSNMVRFLALNLINNDQTLMIKLGNILLSSSNRARLSARIVGSAVIGVFGALFSTIPYAVLMMIIYFDTTENCGYPCSDYFEQLPKEGPVEPYKPESTGHLIIAGNDDTRQIEIYTPSKPAETVISNGVVKTTGTYTKARKKARKVNFSDFKKTHPVLSSFEDLEEPDVPQKTCPINDPHDLIDIRVPVD